MAYFCQTTGIWIIFTLGIFLIRTISVSITHGNLEAVFLVLICKVFQIAFALFDIR